jgi:hypothetical protein
MSHTTCAQWNRGDSRLLVVGSQIVNLTFGFSFGHNLCFKCPNGSCKPILDIYVAKKFQWYKELLNPMGFDPCYCSLKIRESIGTPTPKVGIHLRVWRFNFHTLPYSQPPENMKVTPRPHSWPALLQALALVASLRLGLRHIWFQLINIDQNWIWFKIVNRNKNCVIS